MIVLVLFAGPHETLVGLFVFLRDLCCPWECAGSLPVSVWADVVRYPRAWVGCSPLYCRLHSWLVSSRSCLVIFLGSPCVPLCDALGLCCCRRVSGPGSGRLVGLRSQMVDLSPVLVDLRSLSIRGAMLLVRGFLVLVPI